MTISLQKCPNLLRSFVRFDIMQAGRLPIVKIIQLRTPEWRLPAAALLQR